MKIYLKILSALVIIIFASASAKAQHNISALSIDQIMQGEKFTGYSPENISWSIDGKNIYFDWNPEIKPLREKYAYNLKTGKTDKLSIAALRSMLSDGGEYDPTGKWKVFSKNGDIYIYDVASGQMKQVTDTYVGEYQPVFSADGQYILYLSYGNVFSWNKNTGALRQLTNFIKGEKRHDGKRNAQESYLEKQQFELFEVLRQRRDIAKMNKALDDSLKIYRAKEFYYGEKNMTAIVADPTMKSVCFQLERPAVNKMPVVPDFVNPSGYTRDLDTRNKVGSKQSSYELLIFDIKKDTVIAFDRSILPGIFDKPSYYRDYNKDSIYTDVFKTPREVNYFGPVYNNTGQAIFEVKAHDHKDRWIVLIDLSKENPFTVLDRQHDDAWIGGPGIVEWMDAPGRIGWINDQTVWYQSEVTGYSHIYTQNTETLEKKALTSGDFEILEARLSKDRKNFFITANKPTPFEHHFYTLYVNGGEMKQITQLTGNHEVSVSPEEKYLAIRYSYTNKPWELYLMENKPGAKMQKITSSITASFNNYKWREPAIVMIPASDGVKVPARLYKPERPNGAGVVFVHGAGYLQNVHKWWSTYYREYMFHNMLADNGYTVIDIDYRASEGYGRDWRTAIYRYMGGRDLDDQVDGAKYLVDSLQLDKDRIGIYGGSYGGFMTLMAMFTKPGVFKCGAALRSVTDWAHYNHEYTSNILNTPTEDSVAFRRSSPIYFAKNLRGRLLMLHGMVDTNVHYQDVVRLAQRLIELKKDNWEMAVFPVEDHGFQEATSWTDEYKRIYKMFDEELTQQYKPIKN